MKYIRWITLCAIAVLIMVIWLGGARMGKAERMEWVSMDGSWYCFLDGQPVRNAWVDNDTYFVDESGRMVTEEWVCERKKAEDGYLHSYTIGKEDCQDINLHTMRYVGHDGRKLRNKIIYRTPFRFDRRGYCNLSETDIAEFAKTEEYGLEGLRRVLMLEGGYKEYVY